jgi:hypothetical protein
MEFIQELLTGAMQIMQFMETLRVRVTTDGRDILREMYGRPETIYLRMKDSSDDNELGKEGDLTATFILTDTTEIETATFQPCEEFFMIFELQNTSNDTITYSTGGGGEPPVTLQIFREGKREIT